MYDARVGEIILPLPESPCCYLSLLIVAIFNKSSTSPHWLARQHDRTTRRAETLPVLFATRCHNKLEAPGPPTGHRTIFHTRRGDSNKYIRFRHPPCKACTGLGLVS